MTITYPKTSSDVLDYKVDWSTWLGTDTITSSSWTIPAPLVTVLSQYTTTSTTVFVTGGSDGITYLVSNTINTTGGRTVTRSFQISITTVIDV